MRFISKAYRRRVCKVLAILFALIAAGDGALWIRARFARNQVIAHISLQFVPRVVFNNYADAAVLVCLGNLEPVNAFAITDPAPSVSWSRFGRLSIPGITAGGEGLYRYGFAAIAHRTIVIVSASIALLLVRLGRKVRFAPGACQYCGYDLLATPERCPECGAVSALNQAIE
jgi:hypothetical protein